MTHPTTSSRRARRIAAVALGAALAAAPACVTISSPPSGAGPADAGTLYGRLGEADGIRADLNAVFTAELANPDIATYFVFQAGAPANGHPTESQIIECLVDQIGAATGGPQTYPAMVTTDAGSWTCRDMMSIHAPLLISGGTFETFVIIAVMTLADRGVSVQDLQSLAAVFNDTASEIIAPSLADAGLEPFPGNAGAR